MMEHLPQDQAIFCPHVGEPDRTPRPYPLGVS